MDWELEDVVVTWKIWSEKHVTKRRGCLGAWGQRCACFVLLFVGFFCWLNFRCFGCVWSWIYVHMNKVFKEMLYLFCLAYTCILHTTRKALSHLMWLNLFIPYHTWTDLASGPHTARNLRIAKFLILRHHQVLLLLIPVVFQFRQLGMITPWKFNIGPENIPSQKESSLPTIIFQGLC